MTLAKLSLLVYLLLKPLYFFSSGGLQIADIFLILAFGFLIASAKVNMTTRHKLVKVIKANRLFCIFVSLAFAINLFYFLYQNDMQFMLSSLYLFFNLLVVFTFTALYTDTVFLQRIVKVFKFNLVLQLILFLTGIGKLYGGDRYMGTFNDPNQFGYYIFISFLFIYVLSIVLDKKSNNLPYYLLAVLLIILSASTGMLFGLAIFLLLLVGYSLRGYLRITYERLRRVIHAVGLVLLVIVIPSLVYFFGPMNGDRDKVTEMYSSNLAIESSLIDRVTEKVDKVEKAENKASISIWEDRGYDIIFKYPANVLYGAGEGGYNRFILATHNYGGEVHATLPSIVFYYGVIPFLLLMKWFYIKIKNSDPRILIAYTALFAESFTLLNQRQSLFWMIIILGGGWYSKKAMEKRVYASVQA